MGSGKELLILGLLCMLGKCFCDCEEGFIAEGSKCIDEDECVSNVNLCGNYSTCTNTQGSFKCQCLDGYKDTGGKVTFAGDGQCKDINECTDNRDICGQGGNCSNLIGSYQCTCHSGYTNDSKSSHGHCIDINECTNNSDICGQGGNCSNLHGTYQCICHSGYTNDSKSSHGHCIDINECNEAERKAEDLCGPKGSCKNINGSYWCKCQKGYTNYGHERTPCSELDCDKGTSGPTPSLGGLADILLMMKNNCLALSNPGEVKGDGEALLEKLFTATDAILSPGQLNNSEYVTGLLGTVENAIMLIGPQLKANSNKIETTETEAEIAVQRGKTRPTGSIHLTNENAELHTDWTTAAGTGSYSGIALAALLTYKNLETSVNRSFENLTGFEEDGVNPTFNIFSKVVSVVVSNPSTQNLSHPVKITFRHLQDKKESDEEMKMKYICAYWTEEGTWSTNGCEQESNTSTHTVCVCHHLSSFAVLMALYPIKHTFGLQMVTKIGLTISLLCLILCILTFKFCRSIQGTRTTIHLHLCICLFVADLVFLAGISQTKPVGGCRFVAAMLHYFFLGVFTWMLLEGVQLYRMVVLVFNANIRPLYLYLTGYGIPLGIVIISAIIRPYGYGTDQHCWLSLNDGLIWSFFGPVCLIIFLNIFFFIVTVWKLAQKFTSLNPDLSKLHKIKAFTVTAIAQMCILGLMWVFGAFLFQKDSLVVAYIFTLLNSLQGALVFIMHCLLSKQVRDEYTHFLSCICTPPKKRYSDFSSTNPSSTQSQGTRSGQHTGESQI
ncbi:CD97 antigen Leukocyte antigen CD97 CD97 antigen subunit alpha CD97 antigen subunit beta Precursor [Larimichthys crocea]|uniref:CD97 antigen Leukocyte antigen CD97 CD97 antigen subunit alpha CD97 antigen subunit beta n=1 Tax=Larimichthys crocea TaxID=215358 RepID=A0A6G0JB19_LARCR|nr:CD97 antigen Leukocyte antigen CD97 CD97 antigen subunit alpha CD97 antigen subunit beta Precursor [Larimichthys crocea]